jgi:hypothetical protein
MSSHMTPRERVLSALEMKTLDRPPVVCFTQSVTVDVMEAAKVHWPEAHSDAHKMAELSCAIPKVLGLESVRMPYCLTVEAEIMGCKINLGGQDRTPMLKEHKYHEDDPIELPDNIAEIGRAKVVVDAIKLAKKKVGHEYPIVVGTTGPVTIAGHLVGTEHLLMWMMVNPSEVNRFVAAAAQLERAYIKALAEAGADDRDRSQRSEHRGEGPTREGRCPRRRQGCPGWKHRSCPPVAAGNPRGLHERGPARCQGRIQPRGPRLRPCRPCPIGEHPRHGQGRKGLNVNKGDHPLSILSFYF